MFQRNVVQLQNPVLEHLFSVISNKETNYAKMISERTAIIFQFHCSDFLYRRVGAKPLNLFKKLQIMRVVFFIQ